MIIRLYVLAVLLVVCFNSAFAQEFEWAYSTGTWVDDYATRIITDQDGNSYATGHVSWDATFGNYNTDEWGVFLVKLDIAGNILWAKFGKGSYNGIGRDLALDSEGNVYVGGDFSHDLTFDFIYLDGTHQTKSFLAKFDPNGQVLWAKVLGLKDSSWDVFGAVTTDASDNVYVTGTYSYDFPLENGNSLSDVFPDYWGDKDIYILKFDKQGSLIWAKAAGSANDDMPIGLKVNPQGTDLLINIALGGKNFKYGGLAPMTLAFSTDVYYESLGFGISGSALLVLDTDGAFQKLVSFDGLVSSFDVEKDGSVVVAGTFYQSIQLGVSTHTSTHTEGFIAKLDPFYNVAWSRSLPFLDLNLAIYNDGIFISGLVKAGSNIDDLGEVTKSVFCLAKLSGTDGYAQWLKPLAGGIITQVTSIDVSKKGIIGISGVFTSSTLTLDTQALTNKSGNSDGDLFFGVINDNPIQRCPPLLMATLAADKYLICEGEIATLTPSLNDPRVKWYKDEIQISDPIKIVSSSGEYYYSFQTNAKCEMSVSNTVHIRVVKNPIIELHYDTQSSCNNQPIALSVSSNADYSYQWFKNNVWLQAETQPHLLASSSGTYRALIKNEGICTSEASVEINLLPEEKDFLPDTIFHCKGSSIHIKPSSLHFEGWNYTWSSGETTSEISVADDDVYSLTLSYGDCVAYEEVFVKTFDDIWVPNVITLDNNEKNDVFIISNPGDQEINLTIIDRWGSPIFEAKDYNNDWPSPNTNISTGTYYFIIDDTSCYQHKKGWIHVLK